MKKIYIKENKIQLLEYYNSPDRLSLNSNDLSFEDEDAIAFIGTNDLKCFFSKGGKTHYDIYKKERNLTDDNMLIDGRVWTKSNAVAYWGSANYNPYLLIYFINNYLIKNGYLDSSKTIYILYMGCIMELNDFIREFCSEEDKKLFNNGIYIKSRYNEYKDEEEDKIKKIHLMNQKGKKDALKDYKLNKEKKLGNKLSTYDKNGNFKSEMPLAQWRALHSTSESKTNKKIVENLNAEIEPAEIDLSSFKKEKILNPKIWDNNENINSRVRLKLLDIADDFYNSLNIKWVKPLDIILTGSICNYNWSKYSDIDLHIVVDFSKIGDDEEIIKEYFDSKKNEWNNEHEELNMFGLTVELYVQDIKENAISSGIYSLEKNSWIKKPNSNNVKSIKNKKEKIKLLSSSIMTNIDNLSKKADNINDEHKLEMLEDECNDLQEKIKNIRTKSLNNYGEFSIGNICYKVLRRFGYLDKLWNIKTTIYDKINSIN